MKKDIAILIPCYNSGTTIIETLESIKNQTSGLERVAYIVIADDVSPDNTREVAATYWQSLSTNPLLNSLPKLKFEQRLKNHGEYLNVNMAIKGMEDGIKWFVIMHGDNIAKPNYLPLLIKHIDKAADKTALICGSWQDFDEEHGILNTGDTAYDIQGSKMIYGTDAAIKDTLFMGCWWHISCTAIRISAFKEVGGLPRGMRQKGDYDFLLRILFANWHVEYLATPLMLYRSHAASISSKNFKIHRDIVETLMTAKGYVYTLSIPEVVKWYGMNQYSLFRRFASSILKTQWERAFGAINISLSNFIEMLDALGQKITKNPKKAVLPIFLNSLPEGETPTLFDNK